MGKEVVHKSSHCAWQIHYHMVFQVKYRRALLDEEAVKIITDTLAEISERCCTRWPKALSLKGLAVATSFVND